MCAVERLVRPLVISLVEFLLEWKSEDETWELYQNVAETKAFDEYEHLHSQVGVDIV
jgi:hypothetical protein